MAWISMNRRFTLHHLFVFKLYFYARKPLRLCREVNSGTQFLDRLRACSQETGKVLCSLMIKVRWLKPAKWVICQNQTLHISTISEAMQTVMKREQTEKWAMQTGTFWSISNLNFFHVCTAGNFHAPSLIVLTSISWNSVLNTHTSVSQILQVL